MSIHDPDHYLRHIPNGITSLRLIIAAIFPFCSESLHFALLLLGLASEFLDGFIARLFHWQSYLGQVLDPIADKLFVLSVSITWILLDKLSLAEWLLLATRDMGVLLILISLIIQQKIRSTRSPKARLPSKITTALQYAVFFLVLSNQSQWVLPLAALTALVGIIAVVQYARLLNPGRDHS